MKKNQKLFFIVLLLITGISLLAFVVILRPSGYTAIYNKNTRRLVAVGKTTTQDTSKKISESLKKEESTNKYTAIAFKSPILGWQSIISVKVTNISVTPFLGVVAINECNLVDTQGEEYKGKFFNAQYDFPKALLRGESGEAKISFLSLELEEGGGISYGGYKQKCVYDDQGYKICSDIKPLRISECTVYVLPTGQASNGWGQFPLKVTFPRN